VRIVPTNKLKSLQKCEGLNAQWAHPTSSTSKLNWSLVGFALSPFIPSAAIFQKYLDIAHAVIDMTVASLDQHFLLRYSYPATLGFTCPSGTNACRRGVGLAWPSPPCSCSSCDRAGRQRCERLQSGIAQTPIARHRKPTLTRYAESSSIRVLLHVMDSQRWATSCERRPTGRNRPC
jgi:hypothetical protein